MKATVCLLTYNHLEMSLKCIARLIEHTKFPHRVTWVDNGSDPEIAESILEALQGYYEDLIWIRNDENTFYAHGTNQGLKMSDTEYTVCLSNDVFLSPGWLGKMVAIMDQHPEIGILSPLTDNISGGANVKRHYRQHMLPRKDFNSVNDLRSSFKIVAGNVALFCGMIRRNVLETVGYLDEQFFICGNDDDYNERVRFAGFKTAVALNVYVGHYHSATKDLVFPDRSAIKARHRQILKQKRRARLRTGDFRK